MSARSLSSSSLVRFANSQEGLVRSFRHNLFPEKGRLVVLAKGERELVENAIERLKENYFSSQETSLLFQLKGAVQFAIEPVSDIAKVEIIAAVVQETYIYVSCWGQVSAYLFRGDKLSQIFSGKQNQLGSCSGIIKEGDKFLLIDGNVSEEIIGNSQEIFTQTESFAIAKDIKESLKNSLGVLITVDSITQEEVEEVIPQRQEVLEEEPALEIPDTPSYPRTINMKDSKSLLVRFAEILPERNPFEGRAKSPSTSKKTAISAGLVLLGLLIISIIFGIQQKKNVNFKSSYQGEFTQAQENYNNALLQKDINPSQSRQLFSQAKTVIDQLVSRNIKDVQVLALKAKIDNDAPQILGIIDTAPGVLVDLTLLRQDIKGKEISGDVGNFSVLDSQGNRIVFADFGGRNTGITGGVDKTGVVQTFTSGNNKFYVLSNQGLVGLTKQGGTEVLVKADEEWGNIVKVGIYSGNYYLVDANGAIWRYAPGATVKTNWLKGQVDLSGVSDFAIDGSLWILNNGKIMKFVRGSQETVTPQGLDIGFTNPTAIYTDENLNSLYILDAANKRVVELDKRGVYKKEYLNDQIAEVVDIVVSKSAGKIVLLTQTKVLELQLK